MTPKYKRVMLKLSGESLAGDKEFGLDVDTINKIAEPIKECVGLGVEIAIVVGGGNFWRGRSAPDMKKTTADYMGMLATVINALALQDALERSGIPIRVQTAIEMKEVAEPYIERRAVRHLEKGRVVIFAAGTGSPYFSTDTAAALRAAQIDAELILLAKNVDGVYDSDPLNNPNATKFETINYMDVIKGRLGVMDSTATSLSMDNKIPIVVFGLNHPDNIRRVIMGEQVGTRVN